MLDRLLANWPLKVLSVLLAYAVWLTVAGETRIVQDFDVPVDTLLRPGDVMANPPPTQVTVRLRGPETLIRKLDPLGMVIRLDLRDWPPGAREVQLSEIHLTGVPPRMEVEFFQPPRVGLAIDRRLRRGLPVEPDLIGSPAEGYSVYGQRVRPESIEVEGPARIVREMISVPSDPIRLDGRSRTFIQTVGALPGQPAVRVLDATPIEVRVLIDEAPVEYRFPDVPVTPPAPVADATIRPRTVTLTLTGPAALMEQLQRDGVRATVDLSRLAPGGQPQKAPVVVGFTGLTPDEQAKVAVKSISEPEVTVSMPESGQEAAGG